MANVTETSVAEPTQLWTAPATGSLNFRLRPRYQKWSAPVSFGSETLQVRVPLSSRDPSKNLYTSALRRIDYFKLFPIYGTGITSTKLRKLRYRYRRFFKMTENLASGYNRANLFPQPSEIRACLTCLG